MPAEDALPLVAAALGRPAGQLVVLDSRPLRLAFVPGEFVTITVRDRMSREVLEATVDLVSGAAVDLAALRARNRAAAGNRPQLAPALRDLLLRHPDLHRLEVTVVRDGGATTAWTGGSRELLVLADDPDTVRIELTADPEILDTQA